LRNIMFNNANFRYVDLSGSKLSDSHLVNNNFDYAILMDIDFSGKDLSESSFNTTEFDGSDMQNTNLYHSNFVDVDFTKIKNKSLAGADLSETSFAYSNLSGVSLDNTILETTNFWQADLQGMDFTIADVITDGITFIDTNLSNSNFEGLDLSPKEMYFKLFKDKASFVNLDDFDLVKNLFGSHNTLYIVSKEVRGNDLAVTYIFVNSFRYANLENANFKNANLEHTDFSSADLINADLSGANLRYSYFGYADLSNANLDGANLENVNLENAVLNCKNHPICEGN